MPSQAEKYDELSQARQPLAEAIARRTVNSEVLETALGGLYLVRRESPSSQTSYVHEPSLCLIAQGAKRVLLGKETYTYDACNYLITSVDLPVVAEVTEASRESPYLGLMLKLDLRLVAQMMVDSNLPSPRSQSSGPGMAVGRVTLPLLDALNRLLGLLDDPESIPILGPLIEREILYRLLTGDQGPRLRQIGASGTQSHQIAQAIDWLKDNYARPLRVEELAAQAKMSPSTFHRHFRALTSMSPLQFQKWLRLHEARQMLLAGGLDAAGAAFKVGYESHSQFSREYSRLFGAPPLRDIKGLRKNALE